MKRERLLRMIARQQERRKKERTEREHKNVGDTQTKPGSGKMEMMHQAGRRAPFFRYGSWPQRGFSSIRRRQFPPLTVHVLSTPGKARQGQGRPQPRQGSRPLLRGDSVPVHSSQYTTTRWSLNPAVVHVDVRSGDGVDGVYGENHSVSLQQVTTRATRTTLEPGIKDASECST